MDQVERRKGIDPGWIVVLAVTTIMTAVSGARFLFPVILKPVSTDFGWSRADLAAAVTLNMLVLSVLQPVVGMLIDRYGSQRVLVGGVALLGLTMIPISMATSLWQFYLFYGVIAAFGQAAASPVNITSLVSGWFTKRRGTALSLATSGAAIGQLLIIPLATYALTFTDWPMLYRALALVLLAVMLPLAIFAVREAPAWRAALSEVRDETGQLVGVDLRRAMNTSAFWTLAFGFFVCGWTMAFANVHFPAWADDMGMEDMRAADVIMVTAAFSIVGSLLLGMAADRRPRRQVLALTYALRGLAFFALMLTGASNFIYLYAIILGISWTATTPLTAAIAADIYGRRRIGVIFGTMFTFMNIGMGVGAFIDGLDFDKTGDYHLSLIINGILGLLAGAAVLTVSSTKTRQQLELSDTDDDTAPAVSPAD